MAKKHPVTSKKPNGAVFYRQAEYRKNGYQVISGNFKKKKVYNSTRDIQDHLKRKKTKPRPDNVKPGSVEHAERYYFTYKFNFQRGRIPYKNQAHHLVPVEFYSLFSDSKCSDVAKKLKYNCNKGENIIFLPELKADTLFNYLPYHSGSHDDYNKEVLRGAKDIEQKLQKYIKDDPCKEGDDLPEDIVNAIKDMQDDLWNIVVKSGKSQINTVINVQKRKGKKAK